MKVWQEKAVPTIEDEEEGQGVAKGFDSYCRRNLYHV